VKRQQYSDDFYRYIEIGARRSAAVVLDCVQRTLPVRSVLDVGCGRGVWLVEWMRLGVRDIVGIDGDYVDRAGLAIPREAFRGIDVSVPFRLGRQFDLVQSLEVAEHIRAERADLFVDNLVAHGEVVLFSAAVPGQGGEHHVNEQPHEYWRDKFAARGYRLLDAVRPAIRGRTEVEPWYRYNTFFFVKADRLSDLPEALVATEVPDAAAIAEMSSVLWRMRKGILKHFPPDTITRLALLKHNSVNAMRRLVK
jgi:SAM-dependent methyltransferase